jgi:hypothetical protein
VSLCGEGTLLAEQWGGVDCPGCLNRREEEKPEYTFPGYQFSGANMAGGSLMACLGCGALVKSDDEPRHRKWHEDLGA